MIKSLSWAVLACCCSTSVAFEKWGVASVAGTPNAAVSVLKRWIENDPDLGVNLDRLGPLTASRGTARSRPRAGECGFDFDVFPPDARTWIDEWDFGRERNLRLAKGRHYLVEFRKSGYHSREAVLDCDNAGQWLESVRLEPGEAPPPWASFLRQSLALRGLEAGMVLETKGGVWLLHLYRYGRGFTRVSGPEQSEELKQALLAAPLLRKVPFGLNTEDRPLEEPVRLAAPPLGGDPATPVEPSWVKRRGLLWVTLGVVVTGAVVGAIRSAQGAPQAGMPVRID